MMRHGVLILAFLGLIDGVASRVTWAQAEPRQRVRIIGRVFDQTRRLVERVEGVVKGRDVRAVTDSAGTFQLDLFSADSTVGFRRIGYRRILLSVVPLPRPQDTVLVQMQTIPIQLSGVTVLAHPSKPLRYAGTTKYDEVFLRQRTRLGTLVSREGIEARFGVDTHELLQGMPGV